jgi:ribosomal protein S12 methylthiotransferase
MTSSSFRSIESFYIENLGCAKNQVDSERIIGLLIRHGLRYEKDDPEKADLIIVNTCAFIQPAREEAIQTLLDFRNGYPDKKILAAGCLSERYGNELADSLPELDGFSGNRNLNSVLEAALDMDQGLPSRRFESVEPDSWERSEFLSYPGSVYVKIAEGCRNNCTYCSIPLIRGSLQSRTIAEVTAEVRSLIEKGVYEFNLIAQDLANFGQERGSSEFLSLMEELSALKGDFWLRLLYIHPDHFPLKLLELTASDRRILPYFDIPFQHAAPRILKAMGRNGNPSAYLELLERIRQIHPDAVIRSTFMTGFPGETAEDFEILLDFQQKARLTWLGVFNYSREEGTPAAILTKHPGKREALRRKSIIEEAQIPITAEVLQKFRGREMEVLVEEPVSGGDLAIGRSWLQAPEVDGLTVLRCGTIAGGNRIRARIIAVNGVDLEAVPL